MKLSNWLIAILNTLVGTAVITYIWYGEEGEIPAIWREYTLLIGIAIITNIVGFSMKYASQGLEKLFAWKKYFGLRFITEIVIRNAIVWLVLYIAIAINVDSMAWIAIWEFCIEYKRLLLNLVIIHFLVTLFLSIATFTLYAYNQYSVIQIQSVELQRKQLQLQFEALKSQLSPHYLFNCLNTVSNLVYKDGNLAEEFIRRFAQTYQYVLTKNQQKLVTVEEEIEFVKSFHFLLKTRFGEGLGLSIELPSAILASKIPPLTLQILVENAVKHNVISNKTPLQIAIQAREDDTLTISNNITQKPAHATSLKVGLNNIKKRYAYFTKKGINIQQEDQFLVQLPVLLIYS